jgi:ElaB/YqjD/DUF883 family membrane-anchored ribosome-binding protein
MSTADKSPASDVDKIAAHIAEVRDNADDLAESFTETLDDVKHYVRKQAHQRPYTTLGVAAGVGFILGGGLTLRVGSTLLGIGARVALNSVLRDITKS